MIVWFTRRLASTCLLFLPIFLCASLVQAQQTLGSINGTVLDPSGAAIPGVKITVTAGEIRVTRTTTTQGSGFFQIFNLPIGHYVVRAEQNGFETTEIKGIGVREAEATTVSVGLKLGPTSEAIEIT